MSDSVKKCQDISQISIDEDGQTIQCEKETTTEYQNLEHSPGKAEHEIKLEKNQRLVRLIILLLSFVVLGGIIGTFLGYIDLPESLHGKIFFIS